MSMSPSRRRRRLLTLSATLLALSATSIAQNFSNPDPPATDAGNASVIIVLDNSGSAKNDFGTLKRAVERFARSFSSRDEVALYTAAGNPTLAQDFTGDTTLVIGQLDKLRTKGRLALSETISQAVSHAQNDAANERTAVVAFVNDLDTVKSVELRDPVNSAQQRPPVPVYVVALRSSSWKSQEAAQKIAVLSGGTAYFPRRSSEVESIAATLASRLGTSTETVDSDPDAALAVNQYSVAVVRDIPVAENPNTTEFPGGGNELLQRVLLRRLSNAKLFNQVKDGRAEDPASRNNEAPAQNATGQLEVLPMVVSYQGGIHGPRDLFSPFASPKLRVQVVLRDAATRQPITAFTEEASGAGGLVRGSDEAVQAQAMANVSNKIVKRLREMKERSDRATKRKPSGTESAGR